MNEIYLQCVGFVQAVIAGITGQPLNNGGNAIEFASKVPSGYTYIDKSNGIPQEGDLPIWDHGVFGHIAYITKVYSNTVFEVAEGNYDYKGGVRLRDKSIDDYGLLGWLRKL